jgi:hypothetical protein
MTGDSCVEPLGLESGTNSVTVNETTDLQTRVAAKRVAEDVTVLPGTAAVVASAWIVYTRRQEK